jgi:hypothetical protein
MDGSPHGVEVECLLENLDLLYFIKELDLTSQACSSMLSYNHFLVYRLL